MESPPVFCLSVFFHFTNTCLCFCPNTSYTAACSVTGAQQQRLHRTCPVFAHRYWPFLLFFFFGEVLNDSGGSRGREGYHSVGGSSEGMNGYEELIRWRGREPGATCSTPLSRNSHNAPGFTSSSSLRPGRRPKGNKIMPISTCQWPQMTDHVHSVMYGSKFTHP